MLRISKKADYAVFLLGAIARRGAFPGGEAAESVVSAQEMANEAGLGKSVVANLLKEFAKDGVLDSVRGLRGGYRLTLHPQALTLGRILRVVDGPLAVTECAPPAFGVDDDTSSPCSLIAFCPSKRPMQVVQERIAKIFEELHLDELCGLRTQSVQPHEGAGVCGATPPNSGTPTNARP